MNQRWKERIEGKGKHCYQELEGQLELFEDSGIVRCRGSITRSSLPYNSKTPAPLPMDHYITKLIFEHSHLDVFHSGIKDPLTEVRTN